MIFLRYESFRSYLRMYPGTTSLIALNLIMYIAIMINKEFMFEFGVFISHPSLDPLGLIEPWRYLTAMFMHAGLDHLFFNMFALLVFAPPLERLLKTPRYVIFYLLCGIGGSLLSAIMNSWLQDDVHLAVGASGAIYGVYGAFLFIALFRKSMLDEGSRKTVIMILLVGVGYSLIIPRIDLWGHAGGALAGFLLYSLFDSTKRWKQRFQQ